MYTPLKNLILLTMDWELDIYSFCNKVTYTVSLILPKKTGGETKDFRFRECNYYQLLSRARLKQEARIAHLVEFCLSMAINLTRSCLTISTQENFGVTYHKDHYICGFTDQNENLTTDRSHHAEQFYTMSEFG